MNVIAEEFYSCLWRARWSQQRSGTSWGNIDLYEIHKWVRHTELHAKNKKQAATSPILKVPYCFHRRPVPKSNVPTVRGPVPFRNMCSEVVNKRSTKRQLFHWLLMSFQIVHRSILGILPNHLTLLHGTTPQSRSPKQAYCFMGPVVMFLSVANIKSTSPSASIWKNNSAPNPIVLTQAVWSIGVCFLSDWRLNYLSQGQGGKDGRSWWWWWWSTLLNYFNEY